jgi:TonB family protein
VSRLRTVVWHRLAQVVAFSVITAVLSDGRTADVQTRIGAVEVLSDTQGVDFGPYLAQAIKTVRENWFKSIPERVDAPVRMKGKVAIEFAVRKDGHVAGMKLAEPSGNVTLDRAAWAGISGSDPLPPLPAGFGGGYLSLRIRFYYNQPPDASTK